MHPFSVTFLQLNYIGSLRTAITLGDLKFNGLTFIECLEALTLNGRVVNEYVLAIICSDEAITLLSVEPFDLTCCHSLFVSPILCTPSPIFNHAIIE